ncbi:hypothetical protein H6F89_31915 [Cyanobacteria bacterium FACHB-63]|nr:hypothetical protein [Cyanobacteria bacterium FACHB-63]
MVCSPVYAHRQQQALQKRLQTASDKLRALTPAPGRGKRQVRTEAMVHQQARAILAQHRVEGLLNYQCEKQIDQTESFVGRGRASNRPKPSEVDHRNGAISNHSRSASSGSDY